VDPLQGDPPSPQSFNLFGYVEGRVTTFVDPWGLQAYDLGVRETIEVMGEDPCPEAPPGVSCGEYRTAKEFMRRMMWESARQRAQEHKAPMLATLEIVGNNQKWQECSAEKQGRNYAEFCLGQVLGMHTAVGAGLALAGSESIGKSVVLQGSTGGTSILSHTLGRLLPWRVASTWTPIPGHWTARSAVAGRIGARWIPWVGWGLLAGDAVSVGGCIAACAGAF